MDRKIHIGIFLSSLQDMGGAIRVAVSLANRMIEDYEVSIIELTEHSEFAFPLHPDVNVISLGSQQARLRGRVSEVRDSMTRALKANRPDVMLGIGCEETSVAIIPCRRLRIPLVFCDHGALRNQLDSKSTTALRIICSRACRKTVVLTNQTKEDYERILHLSSNKVVCIPNWIGNNLLNRELQADPLSKRILWAGRLDSEKGVDHLLEIAKIVMPQRREWVWDVYGEAVLDGEGFDLRKALVQEGIDKQVRLCGRYSDTNDVFPHYSIGTLTSYREGLPLFLLEGLAYKMPLISFDIDTGPRDLIADGVNGRLIEPYDCVQYAQALMEMMDSADLRLLMMEASSRKAKDYAEDSVYVQWKNLIQECCTC